jgi:hypothetical protein
MGEDKKQMSFQDLMKKSNSPVENEEEAGPSSNSNKPQNFYAGSGQNIIGGGGEDHMISSIINQARSTAERRNIASASQDNTERSFVGKPRTLYGTEEEFIENAPKGEKSVLKVLLIFWSDGFSIVSPKKTIFYPSGTELH